MTDWPIGIHISTEHNRRDDWKGYILIKYPITAKEEPQNYINCCSNMHENNEGKQQRKNPAYFQAHFHCFSFTKIFDFYCVVIPMTLTKVLQQLFNAGFA